MQRNSPNKKRSSSRHSTRNHILNIIFQVEFLNSDTIFQRLENYYEILEDEVKNEILEDKTYIPYEIDKETILKYISEIIQNLSFIDQIIQKYSIGWETSRISKVDLAILRISIYEIIFTPNIPNKVAINEAVEFAKYYSLENSPKFINGILGKILQQINQDNFILKS